MSLTPSHPRTMSPAWSSSLKLTPTPSPFLKSTPLRSPTKTTRCEASLALRQVIGTTTVSPNAFDSLSPARSFAFTAGAAAVITKVDENHRVSQRFFRARPTTNPINSSSSVYGGPSTPTQNESRNRTAASLRDAAPSPLASPVAHEWNESPSNKAWSSRERIKAATCVSFSPDGKYLAVGETGYRPRVLIFSLSSDAPSDTPLTSLADHTFGVKCLAFSPDSQYLASLGSSNDGFLYIWSINSRTGAATLHASNKCTSNISQMAWMGTSLVTVGTRHVKVWRIEDPNPTQRLSKIRQSEAPLILNSTHKTLPGRNCILENLLDANFSSVVAVTSSKAIVSTDKGYLCLLDDSDGTQRFSKVMDVGVPVTSMAIDPRRRLHLASNVGSLKSLAVDEIIQTAALAPVPPSRVEPAAVTLSSASSAIQVVASLDDYIITVDSERSIRLSHFVDRDDKGPIGEVVQKLSAHGGPVLGVTTLARPNAEDACFCTWSAGGSILFWGQDGSCKATVHVHLEQFERSDAEINELKTVYPSSNASFLVTGDKYGIVRVIDCTTKTCAYESKAHSSEITGVSIYEGPGSTYIATSARDRMVQIFHRKDDDWELMQTLDEHVGAVTGVVFSRNGERLVSMSSDRTVVVRELVSVQEGKEPTRAFLIRRTIILKSSPISMVWDVDQDDVLLLSTIDRQVHKYDLRNGQCRSSFRASDGDGGDAVVLSSLLHIPRTWGSPLIAGVSSTDKSIRIYEEAGSLVARDWGHTEGVTDIAFVQSSAGDDDSTEKSLVTVAVDGTIFIWGLSLQPVHRQDISRTMDLLGPSTPTNQNLLASKPPLRRVYSQSELARFQRSPEDDQATPIGSRSPKLRKRVSKFSLASTPKLEPSPLPSQSRERAGGTMRRSNRNRSPSPPSPRNPRVTKRRSSVDVRLRSKAPANEFGSLGALTESLTRTLRAYRKRLATSHDSLSIELVQEVERELALTTRAVGEKVKSSDAFNETVMQKLLDQYSERLLSTLDEKIAASVAFRVRENSESGISTGGLVSPALDTGEEKATDKESEENAETNRNDETTGGSENPRADIIQLVNGSSK
ncbi:WD repeat protein-like protein [Periconia macrospinosa]|uniref:WD repeat protein-like protein n=1 Tax=Periconia macrospinosa TaxID=97972 RepID=A0A2V1EAD8_9PLEO|nr:WD repeat protein-like protein [Periconia macrospinosa]